MQAFFYFLSKGARRSGFISLSVLFYCVTIIVLNLLKLILKIRIKDTRLIFAIIIL